MTAPAPSDRQRCDALVAERAELLRQLALHKPRSSRHALLMLRLADVTARLLEAENRLAALGREIDRKWRDDDDDQYPDRKSRAAGR